MHTMPVAGRHHGIDHGAEHRARRHDREAGDQGVQGRRRTARPHHGGSRYVERYAFADHAGDRRTTQLRECLDQVDDLRAPADLHKRLGRLDAIGGEPGTATTGEDESLLHDSSTPASSESVERRTVGIPADSRDFSLAGASQAVDRPSAAAGRMSDSKLSPAIQPGVEVKPGWLSACWNSRRSGLVIPTRPESATTEKYRITPSSSRHSSRLPVKFETTPR